MGMIDLDNMDDGAVNVETDEVVSGPTGIVRVQSGLTANGIYDRYQKMVYVFDVSVSMNDGMMPGEIDQVAIWNADVIAKLREAAINDAKKAWWYADALKQAPSKFAEEAASIQAQIKELEAELPNIDPDDMDAVADLSSELASLGAEYQLASAPTPEMLEQRALKEPLGYDVMNDTEFKMRVYSDGLDRRFGITLARTGLGLTSISKLDVVKQTTAKLIAERLDKYPDADITVIEFATKAKARKRSASRSELLNIISTLSADGGSTNIYAGVFAAVEECKARPAALAANHIVLVTDGESHTVPACLSLVDTMKEKNIVLDLVCVQEQNKPLRQEFLQVLQDVAVQTGGTVAIANNADQLNRKMFEASTRLLLGTGNAAK